MVDVLPLKAIKPIAEHAQKIIALPYDVLSKEEACQLAKNEYSFLHITRSEVDLDKDANSHSEQAYLKAKENLASFIDKKWLQQDKEDHYYIYTQKMNNRVQIGVIALCSTKEYDENIIKKHEFTRIDKENDRTEHMKVLEHQVGLVFLAHRNHANLSTFLAQHVQNNSADWSVKTEDQVEHCFWTINEDQNDIIKSFYQEIPNLYIADGHHRSAAAARVHADLGTKDSSYFIAGLFADEQLDIMAYNRFVPDLNGYTVDSFLEEIEDYFEIEHENVSPAPKKAGHISMFLDTQWFSLTPNQELWNHLIKQNSPVASLDIAFLQDYILEPLLGIEDPRKDTRIEFIGGIRGTFELERKALKTGGVAFSMFPTSMDELFSVADAGLVMPPKSTWFEPKLRAGVVVHKITE